jgi:hypothetical protein
VKVDFGFAVESEAAVRRAHVFASSWGVFFLVLFGSVAHTVRSLVVGGANTTPVRLTFLPKNTISVYIRRYIYRCWVF